jgi:hypothetical protein
LIAGKGQARAGWHDIDFRPEVKAPIPRPVKFTAQLGTPETLMPVQVPDFRRGLAGQLGNA